MADVFISYSRKDKEFVRSLHEALRETNCDTWVDWENIPLTADWWAEVMAGIEAADTFVFVLSPDSVASKVCNEEIEHAVKQNKRLVPIVRREGFDMQECKPALSKHNWLFFREEDDFKRAFESLLKAIDTDLAHVKAHTRLLVRALEWENKGRSDSFLLREEDLAAAESWLKQGAGKEPFPTEQQKNYIGKSRDAEAAHQRLLAAGEKAKRMLQEAQEGTRLEREGVAALKQFESQQIEALLRAMRAGQDLQKLVKDGRLLEQYSASSPLLALQTILDNIQEKTRLKGHRNSITSANFSPDGQRILTASMDKTARVWDLCGKQLAELTGHQGIVTSASFSPDGQRILTASYDNTARVWDLSGKQLAELTGHQGIVNSASFSPDGQRILTASYDNTARVWDLSGKQLAELTGHQGIVNSASFSPGGQHIVTASGDNTARVWDLSGKQLAELTGHRNHVTSASFSPDGQRILTASYDNTARVWDLSGKQLAELTGHQAVVTSASFSPDGLRILTASRNGTVKVWDLSGKQLAELTGHQAVVTSASFSPDGLRILTASSDTTAKVWDLSGKQLAELTGHQALITSASFSPDGQRILTALSHITAKVWDLSGKQLAERIGHQAVVTSASFSPDGQRILTASSDETAKVWWVDKNIEQSLQRGCQWLHDYLITHAKDLETLEVCQNKATLTAAAPSLVQEGEEQAKAGNIDEAVATLRKALQWNPQLNFDPETKARQLAAPVLVTKGEEQAKAGNIDEAVATLRKALQSNPQLNFDPETKARQLAVPALVKKGKSLVKEGKVNEAIAAFTQAQKFDPKLKISASSWNYLCRRGSLHGHASEVLNACEKAVALEPKNGGLRDSRGLARALTGNTKGAIEDFEAFIAGTKNEKYKLKRQRWIEALRAGNNPFTSEEIKNILNE